MNIANGITLFSVVVGSVAIFLLINQQVFPLDFVIPLLVLLDKLDGMAARYFNCQSEIGLQLDCLSDAINFGLLITIFCYVLSEKSFVVGAIAPVYVACTLWRLARFNSQPSKKDYFIGLPTTNAAAWLYIVCAVSEWITLEWQEWIIACAMALLSILMVLQFKYSSRSLFTGVLYLFVPLAFSLLMANLIK